MALELKILAEAVGFALAVLIVGWGLVAGWRLARRDGHLRIGAPEGINAAMAVSGVLLISTAMWVSRGSAGPLLGGGPGAPEPAVDGPGASHFSSVEASDAVTSVASTVREGAVRGRSTLSKEFPAEGWTTPPDGDPGPQPDPDPQPGPGPGPGPAPSPSPSPDPQPEPSPSPSPEPEPDPSPTEEPSPSPSPEIEPCDLPPPLICP